MVGSTLACLKRSLAIAEAGFVDDTKILLIFVVVVVAGWISIFRVVACDTDGSAVLHRIGTNVIGVDAVIEDDAVAVVVFVAVTNFLIICTAPDFTNKKLIIN